MPTGRRDSREGSISSTTRNFRLKQVGEIELQKWRECWGKEGLLGDVMGACQRMIASRDKRDSCQVEMLDRAKDPTEAEGRREV